MDCGSFADRQASTAEQAASPAFRISRSCSEMEEDMFGRERERVFATEYRSNPSQLSMHIVN